MKTQKLTNILLEVQREEFERRDESTMSDKHIKFREAIRSEDAKMKKTLDMLRSYKNESI